jgi:DNA-binding MarR family transcriptional regulator
MHSDISRANRFSRTPAAVADYLASTRGTVSRTLASLESKGYLSPAGLAEREGVGANARVEELDLKGPIRDRP